MIPKGKCKCFCAKCNKKPLFYADEALYKLFEKGAVALGRKEVTEKNYQSIADHFYDDYDKFDDSDDDLSASAVQEMSDAMHSMDSAESSYHSESTEDFNNEDVYVSVRELINSNGRVERCNGHVSIRFIPEESSIPEEIYGHFLYREVCFGVTVGDEEEVIIRKNASDRYCPVCKQERDFVQVGIDKAR